LRNFTYFWGILGDFREELFWGFFDLNLEFLGDFFQFELATLENTTQLHTMGAKSLARLPPKVLNFESLQFSSKKDR
jgi:hypothetical protein